MGLDSHGWFSDHVLYSVDLADPGGRNESKELVPDWAKADLDKLASNLLEVDWTAELDSLSGLDGWNVIKR